MISEAMSSALTFLGLAVDRPPQNRSDHRGIEIGHEPGELGVADRRTAPVSAEHVADLVQNDVRSVPRISREPDDIAVGPVDPEPTDPVGHLAVLERPELDRPAAVIGSVPMKWAGPTVLPSSHR
jgi:hypothetical protein